MDEASTFGSSWLPKIKRFLIGYIGGVTAASAIITLGLGLIVFSEPWPAYRTYDDVVRELLSYFVIVFGVTATLALIPFIFTLILANKMRAYTKRFYIAAGALGAVPVPIFLLIMQHRYQSAAGTMTHMYESDPATISFFDGAVVLVCVFAIAGSIGGYVYWAYARRGPPISNWVPSIE